MSYKIFRNDLGVVDAIATTQGASLLFDPQTKTFDESDPLTIELREWEAKNSALDLSDHTPDPVPEVIGYRINNLLPADRNIERDRFPEDINYNTDLVMGLTTKTIDYFGLRVAQIFYQSLDLSTREAITPVPIVFERYFYNWDKESKMPTDRIKQIYFYLQDGSLSPEHKPLPKSFYNVSDRADITTRRRQTILAWLIARAIELDLGSQVKAYFAEYKDQTDKFVLYGDIEILTTVKNSNQSWLDLETTTAMGTVRNAIALCFTKALEATPDAEVTVFLSSSSNV